MPCSNSGIVGFYPTDEFNRVFQDNLMLCDFSGFVFGFKPLFVLAPALSLALNRFFTKWSGLPLRLHVITIDSVSASEPSTEHFYNEFWTTVIASFPSEYPPAVEPAPYVHCSDRTVYRAALFCDAADLHTIQNAAPRRAEEWVRAGR